MSSPDYGKIGLRMHSRRDEFRNVLPAINSTLRLLQGAQLERSLTGEWPEGWSDNAEAALITLCRCAVDALYLNVAEIVGEMDEG